MKISARNQIKGKVVAVQKGHTTGHADRHRPRRRHQWRPFTNEAIDELTLKTGDEAFAVIKASDVMVGK